jgi:ubiquinone/menaquinone biosynthesis C-methylase UbiE
LINDRWKKAQKAERKFWGVRESYSNENLERLWGKMIYDGLNLDYQFFVNKDVLEIGCGPNGIIYYLNAKSKIGLEPMAMNDLIQDWKKSILRNGTGENLPFEDNSFDVAIIFNVLDHCLDPAKVLTEIYRVLRLEGEVLLWTHVLRNQYKFLRRLFDKVDSPHPHHFTQEGVLALVKNNNNPFRIKLKRYFYGLGEGLSLHGNVKLMIGNAMMSSLWLRLQKG